MPPERGQIVSHYRVIEKVGEGGMGVVYTAEDTRLRRTVALKFLSPHRLANEKERTRFQREAQAAAALNHSNICPVYDIGEEDEQTYLAMAFIEGRPLNSEILDGPRPLDEALNIAIQMASGLQAAHAKGVVHRDIKPQNVMITRGEASDLHVTIMDFGLAWLPNRSELTAENTRLGTVAYMSPEQTQGTEFDHRTDLWSLGVVLYEMIAGVTPFRGHYNQAIMFGVVNEEPEPLTAQRAGLPIELDWVVSKALTKDPAERYHSAADFILDLKRLRKSVAARSSSSQSAITHASAVATRQMNTGVTSVSAIEGRIQPAISPGDGQSDSRRKHVIPWLVAAVAVVVAIASFLAPNQSSSTDGEIPLRRINFSPSDGFSDAVIAPAGRYIAYSPRFLTDAIRVRDLELAEETLLDFTTGARGPFWAPDSPTLGYLTATEIRTIEVPSGRPKTVVELPSAPADFSATWSPAGDEIVWSARYSEGGAPRLYSANLRGGRPTPLIDHGAGSERTVYSKPHFLPLPNRRVLAFLRGTLNRTDIVIRDLDSGDEKIVGSGGEAVYSPSGHLVYQEGPANTEALWAVEFSLDSLMPTGKPFRVARNAASPSISADGTLCFTRAQRANMPQLGWRNRSGEVGDSIGQPQSNILYVSLSPNGKFVAVRGVDADEDESDIWVHDIDRKLKTRVTVDPQHDSRPIWTADSRSIVFGSDRGGNYDIYRKAADGSGSVEPLVATSIRETPADWSRDGRYLLFHQTGPDTLLDLWYAEITDAGLGEKRPFLATKFRERQGQFSPNGQFVAYASDRTGRFEVYVERFPEGGDRQKISTNGGTQPRWRDDGRELYFVEGEALMAVELSLGRVISVGQTTELFAHPGLVGGSSANYSVAAGGQRFVVVENTADAEFAGVAIVQNWAAEFRDQ